MRIDLNLYTSLISDFLEEKISGKCFEYAYLKLFHEEKGERSKQEFSILNTLFLDVDEFCSDPKLREEHDIGEEELRRRCRSALERLKVVQRK